MITDILETSHIPIVLVRAVSEHQLIGAVLYIIMDQFGGIDAKYQREWVSEGIDDICRCGAGVFIFFDSVLSARRRD